MPNSPQDNDLAAWHRFFAIEYNNRAWDLAVQSRTPIEDEEMLNAAHAAALHWAAGGDELNQMRAKMLLAEVHALLGYGTSALAYAQRMCRFFLSRETPDWEVAFAHAIHAHAAHAAGEINVFKAAYAEASQALNAISDPDDRAIVQQTFDLVLTI